MSELDTSQVIDTSPAPVGSDANPTIANREEIKGEVGNEVVNWEEAADAEMSAIYKKNNPEREADGKFASLTLKEPVLSDQPASEEGKTEPPSIPPPNSWSADVREKWATLSPDVQAYIAKREKESSDALSQQGMEVKAYEPIKSVLEQHRDIFEKNGLDYSDGLGRLLSAERLLEQNAPAAIKQIADAYGVDLGAFSNGQQQPQNSAEHALHQRIAQLENQLNDTTGRIQQREAKEAETQLKSNQTLIEKFAQDKTDWADLENDVLVELTGINAAIENGLMQAMPPDQKIQKAYDRAQRNNPDAWARKQEADRKTEETKKLAEAQKRAEEAKRSKVVNITSSPASGRTVSSMDDTLRESFRKANSA